MQPSAERAPAVTTTDVLKSAALLLVLADHVGHYLLDDWPILRVIGRLGVPIFFFLIGFAKSRGVPSRWLVFGAALTLVDYAWAGSLAASQFSILFNFAAIRLAMPWIEAQVLPSRWRLAGFGLLLGALIVPADFLIEYGTEGWLMALAGLLQRKHLEARTVESRAQRSAFALYAGLVFFADEVMDYGFSLPHAMLLGIGLIGVALVLNQFRRGDLAWQPGPRRGAILRFCGRYSLEIYAAQIILLAAAGALWSHLDGGEDGNDDDDEDDD